MGRKRYWGVGSGGKSSRRGDKAGRREREKEGENGSLPSGCMCVVFQLFDFHQFQFAALNQQPPSTLKPGSFLREDSPISKGAEAPRNSLEQEEPSFPSTRTENKTLDIQKQMVIKTKTSVGDHKRSTSKALNGDQPNVPSCSSSELINYSPGTKTPNLVARLMGLDLLPDTTPSSSSSMSILVKSHSHSHRHHLTPNKQETLHPKPNQNYLEPAPHDFSGTRSLPETPRISSARRSDVDHHHRLSLQINKENMSPSEEIVLSRISSALRRKRKELNLARKEEVALVEGIKSTSSGNYARQIVKQVKESVSRRVGLDVTNTISNRNRLDHQSREFHGHQDQPKKISKVGSKLVCKHDRSNSSISTCSPRLGFLEINTKLSTRKDRNDNDVPQPPRTSLSSDISTVPPPTKVLTRPKLQEQEETVTKGSKRVRGDKLGSKRVKKLPPQTTSDVIKNKQEEPFVRPTAVAVRANAINPDKKSKRMPLSNGLRTNMTAPTGLLPVKRDPTPPATKIPQKQVWNGQGAKSSSQLSCCSSHSYKLQEDAREHSNNTRATAGNNNNTTDRDKSNGTTTGVTPPVTTITPVTVIVTENGAAEYDYIARMLKRSGLDKDSQVSFARWFSASYSLDPSIFYFLEHCTNIATAYSGKLSQRCNRKLLFQLVDEMLMEILRPCSSLKPWAGPFERIGPSNEMEQMKGSELVELLCAKVRSFPCADCRVLEDIDGLIDGDLLTWMPQRELAFEEEGEGIAREVEEEIVDTLVHETAVVLYWGLKRHSSTG